MAHGATRIKAKVVNPADLADLTVRDLLVGILAQLQAQGQLLRLMALDQGVDIPDELDDVFHEPQIT